MKIRSVSAIPLLATFADAFGGEGNVPAHLLTPASHFRRIRRVGQMATIVVIEADDGLRGYGECFGLPHPLAAASLVTHVIAPALVGADLGEPDLTLADLRAYFHALGATAGAAMEALSGIDIALWDLKARAAGLPLATLLGATPGAVPTYVSPVPFLTAPQDSAEAAKTFVQQGFVALKLKVGRGVDTDVAHVAAIRSALPETPLYLDFNCAYDVPTAIAISRALDDYNIGWLEEPIPPGDPNGLAEVRRKSRIPIAAGENEFILGAFQRLLEADAVDFIQPNISRAGGVSGLLAIGKLCARHGAKLAVHGVGTAVAVAAALHALRAADAVHAFEANRLLNPLRDDLGVRSAALENGSLVTPAGIGHGGEPRPDMLNRYRIDQDGSSRVTSAIC